LKTRVATEIPINTAAISLINFNINQSPLAEGFGFQESLVLLTAQIIGHRLAL
jgi:hypothetical protein